MVLGILLLRANGSNKQQLCASLRRTLTSTFKSNQPGVKFQCRTFVISNRPTLLNSGGKSAFNLNLTSVRNQSGLSGRKPAPKNKQIILLSWRSAVVVLVFGTALLIFFMKLKIEREESIKRKKKETVGKMAIGGPFELLDHNGKLTKSSEFHGSWLLLYFGFTHCPDICPEEMEKLCRAVDLIEKVDIKSTSVKPIFITVDPDRDNVPTVKKYVQDFSPKLIGFTGDKKQIEQVTRAYRVYFSLGPKDEDNDYIVDHTVIIYLVDPNGNFVDYFGQNKTAEDIATATAIHMGTWEVGQRQQQKKSS